MRFMSEAGVPFLKIVFPLTSLILILLIPHFFELFVFLLDLKYSPGSFCIVSSCLSL